jgi:PAS domain S-box-containing protein
VLHPVAVAHRDRERRAELSALLMSAPRQLREGWAGQALIKNLAFRLRHADAAGAVSPEHGIDLNVAAAALAPVRLGERRGAGVAVAFRDSCDFGYSADDQQRVELLAAGASPAAAVRPELSDDLAPDWQRTLEHAPAGIWATDTHGLTSYVNHAACELAGAPEAALVGNPVSDSLILDAHPHPLTPSAERCDRILTRMDGRELWVSISSAPLVDHFGRSHGWVHTIWDITERREREVAARLRASAFEAVADFTEIALAGEDFAVLTQEAVALTADLLGADYVALGEVEPSRETTTILAVHGWPSAHAGMRIPLPDRCPAALCLDEERPIVVRDAPMLDKIEWPESTVAIKPRSCVSASIGAGVGFISAHSRMPGAFSDQDFSFLGLMTAALAARWQPVAAEKPPALAVH